MTSIFPDEFEHYDLSEFTDEELAQFDIDATNKLFHHRSEIPPPLQQEFPASGPSHGSLGGGPALDIAFESLTDAFVEEIPAPAVSAGTTTNMQLTNVRISRKRSPKQGKESLYEQFCSWKRGFSVTDLVSPIWCEVQYEYGLYGARHKPLERRPSTFVSRLGKEIHVQQKVAQQNDRTLKRGVSIHKTLERELRPEVVPVRIATGEERWALRLFNLTAGLDQLLSDGRTRELPVFGVTHGHVIFGIIDEVTRCVPSEHRNQIKRGPVHVSSGLSPAKKKQRQSLFPSIPEETRISEQLPPQEVHDTPVIGNLTPKSIYLSPTFYDLTIIDYKSRRTPSLPPEEDTVSSQLQLMLYHRLLTGLLSPETFDFNALWAKQGIDPRKSFSRSFVEDIGWPIEDHSEFHVDLCSMVAAWISMVHSARSGGEPLRGVGPELQTIYRKAGGIEKNALYNPQKNTEYEKKTSGNSLEALARQEDMDMARAIEESLLQFDQDVRDHGHQNTHGPQSRNLLLDEAVGVSSPVPDNVKLDGTAQDSSLAYSGDTPDSRVRPTVTKDCEETLLADETTNLEGNKIGVLSDRNGEARDEDTSGLSMILGTKKFLMSDERLDAHLEDILQWWFGVRPPRGVELAQSGRCFTCEYRNGCEWREQKAYEATVSAETRNENKT